MKLKHTQVKMLSLYFKNVKKKVKITNFTNPELSIPPSVLGENIIL